MALGAKAAYIGRPYLYGLGAAGCKGVSRVLEILHSEFDTTMALVGERDVSCVGKHILERVPREWFPSSSSDDGGVVVVEEGDMSDIMV